MGRVAYFVSPHGFGHAARACAVIAEMRRGRPNTHFDIFTEVPKWFFSDSLCDGFDYHLFASDIGLIQRSPLVEDLEETVTRLDEVWRDGALPDRLGRTLLELGCRLVVVDISPLGLGAAAAASLPSVLVENFTWDWVYNNYPDAPSRLREHGRRLAAFFSAADIRIQTDPVCEPVGGAESVQPVARRSRQTRAEVRARLEVPLDEPMVVVSMGGVRWDWRGFPGLDCTTGPWIVVPGGSEELPQHRGRLILLPFHTDHYHPDLVAASDVVVSKLGYSTVAEAYHAGSALAYLRRPRFPESQILARWVEEKMVAAEIEESELGGGAWLSTVEALSRAPRRKPEVVNGAERVAEIILDRFRSVID